MSTNLQKSFLAAFLLLCCTATATAQDVDRAAVDGSSSRAWVFFTDKEANPQWDGGFPVARATVGRRARRSSLGPGDLKQLDRWVSLHYIKAVEQTGVRIRRVSRWLNAVSIEGDPGQWERIRRFAFVQEVRPITRPLQAQRPDNAVPLTHRPLARGQQSSIDYGYTARQLNMLNIPAVHAAGYSGSGITVLIIDTGFFKGHTALDPRRIVAEFDFIDSDGNTENESAEDIQYNQHYHGTLVQSVLGGYDPGMYVGPAYRCNFLLAKTESISQEAPFEEDNFVAALEWGEALGADIVSSSVGYLDWYSYSDMDGASAVTTRAVRMAVQLGLLVVTAAGNEGRNSEWGGYIVAPADADSILTVGMVDFDGNLVYSSSRGPTYDGRIKPEVVAPGLGVAVAQPSGGTAYGTSSGTSFATPLVSGLAALVMEARPDWSVAQIREAIMETASNATDPNNEYGWGLPDARAAIEYDGYGSGGSGPAAPLLSIYPNPASFRSNNGVVMRLHGIADKKVRLTIFNILGEQVQTLVTSGSPVEADNLLVWDGRDGLGRAVPSGIYFVRLNDGGAMTSHRMMIQR